MLAAIEAMQEDDIDTNKSMGEHGSAHILSALHNQAVTMLTHCNTGSLATAGYGTALGGLSWLPETKAILINICCGGRNCV